MSPPTTAAAVRPVAGLRTATRELHEALDASFHDADWLRDSHTFGRYLDALATSHREVESRIANKPVVSRTGFLPKSHLVVADLDRLGFVRRQPTPTGAALLPAEPSDDETLGMLYVIEGSQLGGRVIADLARRRLTGRAASATDFLLAYGSDTVARWRRTVAAINESVVDVAAAATAARATFVHVGDRLARERT